MSETEEMQDVPKDCDDSGYVWDTGKKLFSTIKSIILPDGDTGRVAFDDNGDRIFAEYDIINIQRHRGRKQQVSVGRYSYSVVGGDFYSKVYQFVRCK